MKFRHSPMEHAMRGSQTSPPTKLRGPLLYIARVAWVAVAALALGLFIAGIPAEYAHYHNLCRGSGCGGPWQLEPDDVRALESLGLSVGFYALYNVAIEVVQMLGLFGVGAFLFWKKSDALMVLFTSLMLVSFGVIGFANNTLYTLGNSHPVLWLPIRFMIDIAIISFFVSFYLFPDGRFVPRWTRVLVVVVVVYETLYALFDLLPHLLAGVLVLGQLGTLVFAQIYRYVRVSGPVERQQTKWVVFGLTATIAIFVVTAFVGLTFPELRQPGVPGMLYTLGSRTLWNVSQLFIPLSIAIAILHHRLWDIDLIIKRSLIYGSLSAVLAGVFAITDTLVLPSLVKSILGEDDPTLNAVISAVIIAVLFEPLRRRIKAGVNKLSDWVASGVRTSQSPRLTEEDS
jgi:hypothetical protein